jgi:2-hydroxychromene-2-carboxylate isomerase|tara:strand:- start:377 stop:961 length:585 start_codon:yes stop_codon:yes gene_type:complete
MSKYIDFYFDVISPYAFIAHKKIEKIKKNKKILFNYMPFLLGGLHNLAGITAPGFNKFKMTNMKNDCDLVSKKNDIKFKWNDNFPINSLFLMRGFLLIKKELQYNYINKIFDAYWVDNKDMTKEENIISILNQLKIDNKFFFDGISNKKIKDELKKLTNEAFNKEIFGAPTFVVNNKIFWGQDRLEYAIDEVIK